MCGIAGIYIKDPSVVKHHPNFERFANQLLLGIEGRGKHATGFVAVTFDGQVVMDKADEAASDFINSRESIPEGVQILLLHTRYATKGDAKNYRNNHPVIHGSCFTTHNGSIDNDDDLFEKYKFQRTAEVDTEILPALVGITNFEPKRIRDIFKDVEGSCAMATIDPVNHPGKVLLLRTNHHSPLYLIDTLKYTLWASTQTSLKEAWGKVLGTPPNAAKFKHVPSWQFLILDGGDNPVKYDLIIPQNTQNWAGHYSDGRPSVRDPKAELDKEKDKKIEVSEKANPLSVITEEVRTRVSKMRREGGGKATDWEHKGTTRPGRKWLMCGICRHMVLEDDFLQTLGRGRMCCDCAETFNLIDAEKARNDKSFQPADVGLLEALKEAMPGNLRTRINEWGKNEEQVHSALMEFLSEGTGIDISVLEFLMFRCPQVGIKDMSQNLMFLIEKLWEEYDSEYDSLWEEIDPVGTDAFSNVLKKVDGPKEVNLGRSGQEKEGWVFSNANAIKRINNCLFCRKRPKTRLIMADRTQYDFNYCGKHHEKCGVKDCNGNANHTRKDGIRVCHSHARSMKECYADTLLAQMGYSLEAV